jgi:hypothetical protein
MGSPFWLNAAKICHTSLVNEYLCIEYMSLKRLLSILGNTSMNEHRLRQSSEAHMSLASLLGTWIAQHLNPFYPCLALLIFPSALDQRWTVSSTAACCKWVGVSAILGCDDDYF